MVAERGSEEKREREREGGGSEKLPGARCSYPLAPGWSGQRRREGDLPLTRYLRRWRWVDGGADGWGPCASERERGEGVGGCVAGLLPVPADAGEERREAGRRWEEGENEPGCSFPISIFLFYFLD